jgi:RNA polymerase sigma-70 factor (ECF subfamily)
LDREDPMNVPDESAILAGPAALARPPITEAASPAGRALHQHQRQLTARFSRRLGRSEAEDLASEAVARGLGHPAPDGRQAPWLERIFRNLVTDRGRRQLRRGGGELPLLGEPAFDAAGPEETLLMSERARALTGALLHMPPALREAVLDRFYQDRDYEEMAAAHGITVTTARTRVHRALAWLRAALSGLGVVLPAGFGGGAPSVAAALAVLVLAPTLTAVPRASERQASPVTIAQARRSDRLSESSPEGARPSHQAEATGPAAATPTATPALTRRAPPAAAPANPAADEAAAASVVQRFDFDSDEVDGEIHRPGIILLTGDPARVKMGSLIEIPASFAPSMTKMIEDM